VPEPFTPVRLYNNENEVQNDAFSRKSRQQQMPNQRATDAETKIFFYVTIHRTPKRFISLSSEGIRTGVEQRIINPPGDFTIAGSNEAGFRRSPYPPESFHH
jgi:hypothetical protein